MKKTALILGLFLGIAGFAQAQTMPSVNTHAPEQNTQTFPQGEPTARTDSMHNKLMKGTKTDRKARRSSDALKNEATSSQTKTQKTVRNRKTSGSSDQ